MMRWLRKWLRWRTLGFAFAVAFAIWFGAQMPNLAEWIVQGSSNEALEMTIWYGVKLCCYVTFPLFFASLAWMYAHPRAPTRLLST